MNSQHTSNLDLHEIEKFGSHATQWWDTQGPLKTLHQINPARLAWIKQNCPDLHQSHLLDVGCGGGILSESLTAFAQQVTGLDMAQASIDVAIEHARQQNIANITYAVATAEEWAARHPAHYEVITCMEMLEHVPNPQSVIDAIAHMLPAHGRAFFSTINRTPKARLLAIGAAEYLLNWVPKGTHQYDTFIKPSELSAMMRQAGLEVVSLAGIAYRPWLSATAPFVPHDNTDMNYMMQVRKRP